ncbi:HAD family hydrolase [Streptomyces sp. BR1]|uniref:HAD family hydrolase n=1 Tax=Streptomyces sp. BR1 TaxID=1592323 RepID=UPI00402BEC94
MSVIEELKGLIAKAECVLFDFDGPVCHLFARHTAAEVAGRLVRQVGAKGVRVNASGDPHAVLKAVNELRPDGILVGEVEEQLTREEVTAATCAVPTRHVDDLIRAWRDVGARLAITTNNSPRAVECYLTAHGLIDCFAPHIHGRTTDLRLLKPDPYCLHQALDSLGARPAEALMIGDTLTDWDAAQRAGVPFLGYVRNDRRARELRAAGAPLVVTSLADVLEAVRGAGRT